MEFTAEDSALLRTFKKIFGLWLAAMAVITVYGGLQIGWWLGIIVATAWLGAVLFIDNFSAPKTSQAA